MLSAMTTSENFSHINKSRCSQSPYESTIQPSYLTNLPVQSTQTSKDEKSLFGRCLFQESNFHREKLSSPVLFNSSNDEEAEEINLFNGPNEVVTNESEIDENNFRSNETSRNKLEIELTDLLEQLETDDPSSFDQSKPLKIDPNVLKLDFSKLTSQVQRDCNCDKLCFVDFFEMKRTSHHLSGGCLLTNTSEENFKNFSNDFINNKSCKLSGRQLISTENVFNFEKSVDLNRGISEMSQFLNQISPSSPLTFDLSEQQRERRNLIPDEISSEVGSTNPFRNFTRDVAEENFFPATNPFNDYNSSSLCENPSINFFLPKYENISPNQKSLSQSSTRPASPVLKMPEDSSISNPFLINDTSPALLDPSPATQFAKIESKFPNLVNSLPNSSSFILAVPVFPIFQPKISNSSTQTVDLSKPEEPVYQNVSNQISKFIKRNDHSEYDFQCLRSTMKDLKNSGWYYENASWQESAVLLANTEPGTFLIRDSSDPNFLFSLSVQTSRGPTSVRIHYVNGQFRLDAEKNLIPHMPSFNSVIELIDYYVESTVKNKSNKKVKSINKTSKHKLHKSKDQVWIDAEGNIYSNILLVKPLPKRDHFYSLQHLARLVINKLVKKKLNAKAKFNFKVTPVYESSPFQDSSFPNNFENFCPILNIDVLPLPSKLLEYLKEYPYCH